MCCTYSACVLSALLLQLPQAGLLRLLLIKHCLCSSSSTPLARCFLRLMEGDLCLVALAGLLSQDGLLAILGLGLFPLP